MLIQVRIGFIENQPIKGLTTGGDVRVAQIDVPLSV
jgi:hypothetical protein